MTGSVHRRDAGNGVVVLEIDNPPMNAMGSAMLRRLADTMLELEEDFAIRAIVLTGRGRAFCSGADLKEAARPASEGGGENLAGFDSVFNAIAKSRAPVIAAINGHCVGGGFEIALCCDLRIASQDAKFVCAGVNMGLMASAYRLPRLIGVSRAMAMLLTGAPYDAATCEAWGLVTAVHASDDLEAAALSLANRIASRAPLSVEATKRTANRAPDVSLDEANTMLAREMAILRHSADHLEAVAAFTERREPVFSRR